MDKLQKLRLEEALLVQELELIRAKIAFFTVCEQKEVDNPCPAMEQNQPESLNSHLDIPSPAKSGSSPVSEQSEKSIQSSTTPELTATGKGISNPLIADALLKSMNGGTTSKLVRPSDLSLRPNAGIPIPEKTDVKSADEQSSSKGIQIPISNSKAFYVVFNGNNAGIYDSWDLAKLASEGVSNVKHKKYKSFLEAKTSADLYTREKMIPHLQFIAKNDFVKPNSFAQAVSKGKSKVSVLGSIPYKKQEPSDDGLPPIIRISDFEYIFKLAKTAGESAFVESRYFTTDKKNISLFNFCKNADPEFVFEAFQLGLIDTIYPSKNLLEISHFPKEIKKAIKNYRTKCLNNSDKDIFIKIKSSIPVWRHEAQIHSPKHLIQIGVCKEEHYHPSKVMKDEVSREDYFKLGVIQYEKMINSLFEFNDQSKVFVNYCSPQYLIYSKSLRPISEEDGKQILIFRDKIAVAHVFGPHDQDLCKTIMRHKSKVSGHAISCQKCAIKEDKDVGPQSNDPPSTSKERIM